MGDSDDSSSKTERSFRELAAKLEEFSAQLPVGSEGVLHRLSKVMGLPAPSKLLTLRNTITKETDRGCALIIAAVLDDQLGELLRCSFIDAPEASSAMLDDGNAPLGSFSSRIHVCHLLGLIPPDAARALNQIRKIRNKFAHEIDVSFKTQSVVSHCNELFADPTRHEQTAREKFTTNGFMLLGEIQRSRLAAKRPSAPAMMSTWVVDTAKQVAAFRKLAEEVLEMASAAREQPGDADTPGEATPAEPAPGTDYKSET